MPSLPEFTPEARRLHRKTSAAYFINSALIVIRLAMVVFDPAFARCNLACNGTPPGLRMLRAPSEKVAAAREELERHMSTDQRTLEMQYAYSASKQGLLKPLRGSRYFPACYSLMEAVERAFAIESCDRDRLQAMVRCYKAGQQLRLHIDDTAMFEGSVLSVILRCDGHKDGLVLRPQGVPPSCETCFAVDEEPGVALCLEGSSRYDFGHEVPPVTAPRLSLTWRWFRAAYMQRLSPHMR